MVFYRVENNFCGFGVKGGEKFLVMDNGYAEGSVVFWLMIQKGFVSPVLLESPNIVEQCDCLCEVQVNCA
ncbi:hypothetical protein HNR65_000302 [Desulfosalsimonas propionicica]|uniref:Uncharacterized protein n=1 Tax=Desulfosalsimonas propionicica TaxID=332175 RepID=A0A7W0HJB0_9BACT|nr:hypothetical protein [Desulfosalsimonas propionicica]MBA2879995.1 hypothetical protein [Desulfosalsimonas propionicica]